MLCKFSGVTALGSDSFLGNAISIPLELLRVSSGRPSSRLAFLQFVLKQWSLGARPWGLTPLSVRSGRVSLQESLSSFRSPDPDETRTMYGHGDRATGRWSPGGIAPGVADGIGCPRRCANFARLDFIGSRERPSRISIAAVTSPETIQSPRPISRVAIRVTDSGCSESELPLERTAPKVRACAESPRQTEGTRGRNSGAPSIVGPG